MKKDVLEYITCYTLLSSEAQQNIKGRNLYFKVYEMSLVNFDFSPISMCFIIQFSETTFVSFCNNSLLGDRSLMFGQQNWSISKQFKKDDN